MCLKVLEKCSYTNLAYLIISNCSLVWLKILGNVCIRNCCRTWLNFLGYCCISDCHPKSTITDAKMCQKTYCSATLTKWTLLRSFLKPMAEYALGFHESCSADKQNRVHYFILLWPGAVNERCILLELLPTASFPVNASFYFSRRAFYSHFIPPLRRQWL